MSSPSVTLETVRQVGDVDAEAWDALAARTGVGAFYRHAFLAAFEQFPLHAVDAYVYLVGRGADGGVRCGVPLYLIDGVDPMRVLADHLPEAVGERVLLSHVWHCYDGRPPVLDDHEPGIWSEIVEAALGVARAAGAAWLCFANVATGSAAARGLAAAGLASVVVDERFVLALRPPGDYEAYLASLAKPARQNLRRYARIADAAGVEQRVVAPADADLDVLVELARATAEKFGNAGYYDRVRFPQFLRALGDTVRVIELRHDGRLFASALMLLDAAHVHWWSIGCDNAAVPRLSPSYIVLSTIVREAFERGVPWVELGRRNADFKRRNGATPQRLAAFVSPVRD